MESVFVAENPTYIDLFVNECNEVAKVKIGEIFQLSDNTLSMCCVHCSQEFHYFTEFSLHIQEHFFHNEIANLNEAKTIDSIKSIDQNVIKEGSERIKGEENAIFDAELELLDGWMAEKIGNCTDSFEPDEYINIDDKPVKQLTKLSSFIEGIDYKQLNDKFCCLVCSHESISCELFHAHLLTHSNASNILCPICSKTFTSVSYVRKHVNRTHKMKITADKIREAQPSFIGMNASPNWPMETKSFIEGEDYKKINGRFKCLTCGREMLDHIKEHLLTHSNAKNVYCPICDRPFIAVSYVRKHVNRAHKMKITADEIKAAQTMSHVSNDKQHFNNRNVMKSVTRNVLNSKPENPQKNFECFDCHRVFTGLSSLRIHSKLHSGIKYTCPYCDKLFAMRSYVRDHIVALHGIKRDEIPKDCIRQATETVKSELQPNIEWFECNLCKNRYNKIHTLRQHMKSHTTGPFLCVTCGSVFKSFANLRCHMEIHQADSNNRHKCLHGLCNKTYPTRRYMLSHYRTIHLNKRKTKQK